MLDPSDIFKRVVLRQAGSEFSGVSYESSYAIMKRLYEAVAAVATKVLHQGRGELQRHLDGELCPLEQIKRLCKYVHDDQTDSYLLNPPIAALLCAAGYDHEMPRAAFAAHLSVAIGNLSDLLLPQLADTEAKVEAEFAKMKSGAEAAKHRLFCARGCLRAIRLVTDTFVACAAARPRSANGCIDAESLPLWKLFYARNRLFQLPFFSSSEFLMFAGKVAEAEQREMEGVAADEMCEGLGLSPVSERLDSVVMRRVQPLNMKIDQLLTMLPAAPAAAAAPADAATPTDSTHDASSAATARNEPEGGKKPRKSSQQHAAALQAKRGPEVQSPRVIRRRQLPIRREV